MGREETDIVEMIDVDLEVHDVIVGLDPGHKTDVDLIDVTTKIAEIADVMIELTEEKVGATNVETIHMKNAETKAVVLHVY